MGAVFRIFPLILGIVIVYNLVVFGGLAIGGDTFRGAGGIPNMEALLSSVVFVIPMVSGPWAATWGTFFVTVGQSVVDGLVVKEIHDNRVVLNLNGESVELSL